MKAEKLIEKLNEMVKRENDVQNYTILHELIEDCKQEIKMTSAKENGKADAYKIISKWIAKNPMADRYPCMKLAKIIDGIQYFCDGYICYALKNHIPFEETKDSTYPTVDRFFVGLEYGDELKLPNLAELKKYVKYKKSIKEYDDMKTKTIYYSFGTTKENKPLTNAELLIQVMSVMGENVTVKCKGIVNSLYFENESGDKAILMPIKRTSNPPLTNLDF